MKLLQKPLGKSGVCTEVHLAIQDVKTASYGFQHTVRDSVCDDVTVPWYVFLSVDSFNKQVFTLPSQEGPLR